MDMAVERDGVSRAMPPTEEPSISAQALAEEREHFMAVVNAFLYYRSFMDGRLKRVRDNYQKLPAPHRQMLPDFPQQEREMERAVDTNYQFVRCLLHSAMGMFENSTITDFDSSLPNIKPASSFHMEKVMTTIKQFFRDWSEEGAPEREMCYKPIIDEIVALYPSDTCPAREVAVLVPGAGLGRLAFEIARHGYSCQGNEFSAFMLLGSNFILNQSLGVKAHSICPWVHQHCNIRCNKHQTAVINVPDVSPSDSQLLQDFSMSAGDFLEVYKTPDEWDCVACCFFIDTAHNVIRYLEKIYHILKPGGYWINFGPLLYHFADMPHEFSIELSWEDIRRIAVDHIGFEIVKELHDQPSSYIQNPHSMMEMKYKSVFLVARKPATSSSAKHSRSTAGAPERTPDSSEVIR